MSVTYQPMTRLSLRKIIKHSDLIILFHQSKNNFDYKEFYEDKEIDEDFKSRVVFASPDMAWDTVPF